MATHVDKVTWDGWCVVMSSNGGGTSFVYKFPSNGPNHLNITLFTSNLEVEDPPFVGFVGTFISLEVMGIISTNVID